MQQCATRIELEEQPTVVGQPKVQLEGTSGQQQLASNLTAEVEQLRSQVGACAQATVVAQAALKRG